LFVLGFFLQPRANAQLTVTDVSPDNGFGTTPNADAPGGRIVSLVVDPNVPNVLYAAAELSGVWKSVDGGRSWQWSSTGIRTAITASNYALAVGATNSNRLMYAAEDDDGRIPCPTDPAGTFNCGLGGLYVSDDAGSHWQRVSLPNCPASPGHAGTGTVVAAFCQ